MYQKVDATGFVVSEPAHEAAGKGNRVTTFAMIVNRRWTTASGEPQEKNLSLAVTAWGRSADLATSLQIGDPVNVEGWVEPHTWLDEVSGEAQAQLEVNASALHLTGEAAGTDEDERITQYAHVLVVGRLGKDPELRMTPSGIATSTFNVATSRREGETEQAVWFRVTCWRKLAELANRYLRKGRLVLVEGDLDLSAWLDRNGSPQATLELSAANVRFLGGRDDGHAQGSPFPQPSRSTSAHMPNGEEQ